MNIAPILWAEGKIRSVRGRTVAAYAGREASVDETTGRPLRAQPPRDAYEVQDVVMLTDEGFLSVVIVPGALEALGGDLTGIEEGSDARLPVRAYVNWVGPEGRKFPTAAFSLAGEVLAQVRASGGGGRRSGAVSAVS